LIPTNENKNNLGNFICCSICSFNDFCRNVSQAEAINTNPKNPNAGGGHSPDFKITGFAFSGSPTITVSGTAGATIPDEDGDIYAYVFFTDDGAFAVASHDFIDENSGEQPGAPPDLSWHGHEIFVDQATGCLTGVTDEGTAAGIGTGTVSITGTGATTFIVGPFGFSAGTMGLSVTDEGAACIKHVFSVL